MIGGQADIGFDYASTYWTEPTGWVEIPSIIASASVANAVTGISADATIMVGLDTGSSPFQRELFIWDPDNGPRPLQETLEQDYGVDFLGWQLTGLASPWENEGNVMDISSDGNAIVGVTLNQQLEQRWGWIVVLASCPADVDGSGAVDIDDIFAVLSAWGPCDDCPEDVNDDGYVDIDDIFAVLANWGPC